MTVNSSGSNPTLRYEWSFPYIRSDTPSLSEIRTKHELHGFLKEFSGEPRASVIDFWIGKLKQEIWQVFQERQEEDWDGFNAAPLLKASMEEAANFASDFPPAVAMRAEVSPEPDGQMALEWFGDGKDCFSISFSGDGYVYYAGKWGDVYCHGKGSLKEGVLEQLLPFIKKTLP